eukprot:4864264-Pleurochrysis_carterae.AAC.4
MKAWKSEPMSSKVFADAMVEALAKHQYSSETSDPPRLNSSSSDPELASAFRPTKSTPARFARRPSVPLTKG